MTNLVIGDNGKLRKRREYEEFNKVLKSYNEMIEPYKIALIGSTSFDKEFRHFQEIYTLKGYVVYTISGKGHDDGKILTNDEKMNLMALTFWKLKHSDFVLIINASKHGISDYIGSSTENEILFCRLNNIPFDFAFEHNCKEYCVCRRRI